MRAWHVCPSLGLTIGAAAKCGSSTLSALMEGKHWLADQGKVADYSRVYAEQTPKHYRTVMVVRDPVARFLSLYANIQQRERSKQNFYAQFEQKEPFDVLLGLNDKGLDYDFHCQPQYRILPAKREVEYVRLEDLGAWWTANYPHTDQPTKENQSEPLGELDYKTATLVKKLYRQDLELWEKAWK
jgi:hypothetical protein